MKEWKLDHGVLAVSVNGKVFPFRADSHFAERACALGDEAKKRALMAAAEGRQDPEGTRAFLSRAIDILLETEAVAAIFEEEEPDILDLLAILDLVMDEFHRYRAERLARLKEGIA
jgi:hypothetical protein